MADEPVSAWREPCARRARRWARRNRTAVTGAAAACWPGWSGCRRCWPCRRRPRPTSPGRCARPAPDPGRANAELTRSQAAVQARYDLAVEAIKTFHTGVSEDFLLKEEQFKELRDRLLKSAADFYGKLGALLGKETDLASRRALAAANFELAELTGKVGRKEDALAAHRAVLAAREALAAEPGADAEAKADVGRSLTAVAGLLEATGKTDEAVAAYRRSESLLAGLAGCRPGGAGRAGGLPVAAGLAPVRHGQDRRGPGGLPAGAGRPGGAGRGPRGLGRGPPRPGGHDPPHRRPAVGDGQAGGGGGRVPQGAGDPAEAGRRQPRRHRLPQRPGGQPQQPRLPADAYGQAGGGGGRVPQGAGDPAEAGRRQPRRHRIPQRPGGQPQQPRQPAVGDGQAGGGGGRVPQGAGDPAEAGRRQPRRHRIPQRPGGQPPQPRQPAVRRRASRRRRRPSTARRWRSSRSWPTTTPPSPNSAATWRTATATSATCCRRRASRRRRRPSTARRWRSSRSWPTTTPKVPDYRALRGVDADQPLRRASAASAARPRPATTASGPSRLREALVQEDPKSHAYRRAWPRATSTAAWPAAPWATPPAPRPTPGGRWRCSTGCRRDEASVWFCPRAHAALAGWPVGRLGRVGRRGGARPTRRWPCCTRPSRWATATPPTIRTEDALDPLRGRDGLPAADDGPGLAGRAVRRGR